MGVSYKGLWKKSLDLNLNKTQLRDKAGITNASLSRLSKNQYVSMETLERLCNCLDCGIEEIIKFEEDNLNEKSSK